MAEERQRDICVAVRFRPISEKERQRGEHEAWGVDAEGNVGLLAAGSGAVDAKYAYDTVFGPQCNNEQVFESVGRPAIAPVLAGVNCTVMCYGVTSSGKTHTMMGTPSDSGVVPRAITALFEAIRTAEPGTSYTVKCSMFEIYKEVLNDLLVPSGQALKVREDSRRGPGGAVVEGLSELKVVAADAALALIASGLDNRKVGTTVYNQDSSRSHTLCRLSVESAPSEDADSTQSGSAPASSGRRMLAHLVLVDLAGSESAKATITKGQRAEGAFINKSLLTLGTVIHKLADRNVSHIPFRDSKLTRLLQGSLSGSGAVVSIICNVTPASSQAEETHNTLKFASRAKQVRIRVRSNEVVDPKALVARCQKEIAQLREQLAAALAGGGTVDAAVLSASMGAMGSNLVAELDELQWRLEEQTLLAEAAMQERDQLEDDNRQLTRMLLKDSLEQTKRQLQGTLQSTQTSTNVTPRAADGADEFDESSGTGPSGLCLRPTPWAAYGPVQGGFHDTLDASMHSATFTGTGAASPDRDSSSGIRQLTDTLHSNATAAADALATAASAAGSAVATQSRPADDALYVSLEARLKLLERQLYERDRTIDQLRTNIEQVKVQYGSDMELRLAQLSADRAVLSDDLVSEQQTSACLRARCEELYGMVNGLLAERESAAPAAAVAGVKPPQQTAFALQQQGAQSASSSPRLQGFAYQGSQPPQQPGRDMSRQSSSRLHEGPSGIPSCPSPLPSSGGNATIGAFRPPTSSNSPLATTERGDASSNGVLRSPEQLMSRLASINMRSIPTFGADSPGAAAGTRTIPTLGTDSAPLSARSTNGIATSEACGSGCSSPLPPTGSSRIPTAPTVRPGLQTGPACRPGSAIPRPPSSIGALSTSSSLNSLVSPRLGANGEDEGGRVPSKLAAAAGVTGVGSLPGSLAASPRQL